jgi:hypothetical protein
MAEKLRQMIPMNKARYGRMDFLDGMVSTGRGYDDLVFLIGMPFYHGTLVTLDSWFYLFLSNLQNSRSQKPLYYAAEPYILLNERLFKYAQTHSEH